MQNTERADINRMTLVLQITLTANIYHLNICQPYFLETFILNFCFMQMEGKVRKGA